MARTEREVQFDGIDLREGARRSPERIWGRVCDIAAHEGGLEEVLTELIVHVGSRRDLVEAALAVTPEEEPEEEIRERAEHLLEVALTTGVFH